MKLLGTHRGTFRTDEGLNSRHNASVTYDARNGRYYVMLLASSSRHVAVISDLHRFGEHFTDKPAPEAAKPAQRALSALEQALAKVAADAEDEGGVQEPDSLLDFQRQVFDLLRAIERERFNMPWRWNTWSRLYANALAQRG
jgi:hypothetical protein